MPERMRIAVLAWGSLVWQPRNAHGEIAITGGWHDDGPRLPVEFARISSDGRLTLILVPGYQHRSRVLWAHSAHDDLRQARANLAERETGAPLGAIHGVTRTGKAVGEPDPGVAEEVTGWLERRSLDAAIWTGLGQGDRWGRGGFGAEAAVAYVDGLTGGVRERTEEYVRRAPSQVDTPVGRSVAALLRG